MEPTVEVADAQPLAHRLRLVPFEEIQLSTERPYLVKGLIPRGGLTVVWGPPKCGKSYWAFDVAMHIALGWDYRDRRVHQGPVVYVACEGANGFRARVEAFRQRHLAEQTDNVPFYLIPATLDLVGDAAELIDQINGTLSEQQPVAVVIDTLNRSLRGSESSDEDMSAYIKAADAVREAFGCAVIIIHHCGHEASRPRGHTSLTGAVDAQLAVKRDAEGAIICQVEWMKDGLEGEQVFSRLEVVEVADDEDGDPITACVIVPTERSETENARRLTGSAKIAFDLLRLVIDEAGEQAPTSNHIPRTNRVVRGALWRAYCDKGTLTTSDKPDTKNKTYTRVVARLQELGLIGVWQEYVWIVRTSRT
ncbi:MAG: AAA family ATPase [Proteobacteria bacterium]|nr:AAA family ATPase [Pseudomonadota bacterium]